MQVSFGRAIKIQSDTNSKKYSNNPVLDPMTEDIINTMKEGKSAYYDDKISCQIGEFLRACVGDYTSDTGMSYKKIAGDVYLFTGCDAVRARDINDKYNRRYKRLEELYKAGPKEDTTEEERQILQDEEMHETLRQKVFRNCDDELLDMAELKDKMGKRKSSLKFAMDKSGKLSSIRYQSRIIDENQSLSEERSFWI